MVSFFVGFGIILIYLVLCFSMIFLTRRMFSDKSEVFRKLLHFGILFSVFVFLYAFEVWWHAVIACLVLSILLFPVLHFAERLKFYSVLLVQRKPNEVKWSMIQMFSAFGIVISISKGIFGSNALAVASLFVWGFGDAAAALIGKNFGRHKLRAKMIEGTKSIEGSVAMAVTAFLICAVVLLSKGSNPWYISIFAAASVGTVSSVVELYTRNGADTITVPLSALAVLSGILWAFGGIKPVWM